MRRLLQWIRWFLPRSPGDARTIHELHEELAQLQQRVRENETLISQRAEPTPVPSGR